jgi:uncharacterized protein (DUF4415 family)
MNVRSKSSEKPWVDPDDAPELTDEFFEKAAPMIDGQPVLKAEAVSAIVAALKRGRPRASAHKVALTVRYDEEVVEAFKASGPGWQTRMNAALKDWLKSHSPA